MAVEALNNKQFIGGAGEVGCTWFDLPGDVTETNHPVLACRTGDGERVLGLLTRGAIWVGVQFDRVNSGLETLDVPAQHDPVAIEWISEKSVLSSMRSHESFFETTFDDRGLITVGSKGQTTDPRLERDQLQIDLSSVPGVRRPQASIEGRSIFVSGQIDPKQLHPMVLRFNRLQGRLLETVETDPILGPIVGRSLGPGVEIGFLRELAGSRDNDEMARKLLATIATLAERCEEAGKDSDAFLLNAIAVEFELEYFEI